MNATLIKELLEHLSKKEVCQIARRLRLPRRNKTEAITSILAHSNKFLIRAFISFSIRTEGVGELILSRNLSTKPSKPKPAAIKT